MSTTVSGTNSTRTDANGLAIAGLVCGIIGVFFANVILGPLAIIFGGIAWSKANQGAPRRGMAIAAVILGIVDIALFVIVLAATTHHGGYWHVG
jgi:Domain of unknown function (DUF4190)